MTLAPRDLTRIVHPTDLSLDGDIAFAHALKIALDAMGRLSLVHTSNTAAVGNEWSAFPKVRERLARWNLLPPGASEDSVGDLNLQVTKADLDSANPAQAVAAYVELHGCDLIVLATHVGHDKARWLSRSVAEPLARAAKTPTLFLPHGAAGFINASTGVVRLRNILIPVDVSPDPKHAVELASSLSRCLGAENVVLHLLHIGASPPELVAQPVGAPEVRRITRAAGDVVRTICSTADEIDADLIVMTTRGHDGFLDALRGSTTEQVLRHAKRALLAAPES